MLVFAASSVFGPRTPAPRPEPNGRRVRRRSNRSARAVTVGLAVDGSEALLDRIAVAGVVGAPSARGSGP